MHTSILLLCFWTKGMSLVGHQEKPHPNLEKVQIRLRFLARQEGVDALDTAVAAFLLTRTARRRVLPQAKELERGPWGLANYTNKATILISLHPTQLSDMGQMSWFVHIPLKFRT